MENNMNYKEIKKRHMELMNSEVDQTDFHPSTYSNQNNEFFNNKQPSSENTSTNKLIQITLNYKHEQIPNIFTTQITINSELLDLYDGFYKHWKEMRSNLIYNWVIPIKVIMTMFIN